MMDQRRLGSEGLVVSETGLGCMGMSEFYGAGEEDEYIATIRQAIDLGVNLLDTTDMYGPFTNERLVGKAIDGRRDEVNVVTKFGMQREEDGTWLGINGRPEYAARIRESNSPRVPGGRLGRPEEVAEMVHALVTTRSLRSSPSPWAMGCSPAKLSNITSHK
jgi:aryl-alcohol dehydrogenase-like predicted oxidoreductase